MLLNFNAESRRNHIYNEHGLVGFPLVFKEDYSTGHRISGSECFGNATISEKSELVPLENFTAQVQVLKGREQRMKVMHRGYHQFWMALQVLQ